LPGRDGKESVNNGTSEAGPKPVNFRRNPERKRARAP
jgi:hypothetical protein